MGIYFEFTREEPDALGMTQLSETAKPNLLEALPQQLGQKFEGTKTAVDVIHYHSQSWAQACIGVDDRNRSRNSRGCLPDAV